MYYNLRGSETYVDIFGAYMLLCVNADIIKVRGIQPGRRTDELCV